MSYNPSTSDLSSDKCANVAPSSSSFTFLSENMDGDWTPDELALLCNPPYELSIPLEELLSPSKQVNTRAAQSVPAPPRPQNPWVIFRKDFEAKLRLEFPNRNFKVVEISDMASARWKELPFQVQRYFTVLKKIAAARHKKIYPNYKYKPRRKPSEKAREWVFKDAGIKYLLPSPEISKEMDPKTLGKEDKTDADPSSTEMFPPEKVIHAPTLNPRVLPPQQLETPNGEDQELTHTWPITVIEGCALSPCPSLSAIHPNIVTSSITEGRYSGPQDDKFTFLPSPSPSDIFTQPAETTRHFPNNDISDFLLLDFPDDQFDDNGFYVPL